MTFKEAKKLLEKEGFTLRNIGKTCEHVNGSFLEYEYPEVVSAVNVVSAAGYDVSMEVSLFEERKARLKEEYEDKGHAFVARTEEEKEENPALKESASQFNDALLDEQAKEIKRLSKKVARLNKIIHKKNLKIEELRKESSRHLEGKMKMFGENVDLEQMVKDKDAVLSDVAEELRLSKIREKNLVELCQKYKKENEELKEKYANGVVDRTKAQALKSIESALAYREKMIEELKEKLQKTKKYRISCDNAEEGADLSGEIVLWGEDFIDALKKVKGVWQE